MQRNHYWHVVLIPSLVMLIPAISMLLGVDGWNWSALDFILAWMIIAGVGLAWKLISLKTVNRHYRLATALALADGCLLFWVNGAVGLIGSENNPANIMYAGVLAIGLIGSFFARFEPSGMAITAFAAAVSQFIIPVIALGVWTSDFSPGIAPVFALNFFFVILFVFSALLYRNSGKQ